MRISLSSGVLTAPTRAISLRWLAGAALLLAFAFSAALRVTGGTWTSSAHIRDGDPRALARVQPEVAAPAPSVALPAGVDLGAVMARVHFAFRNEADAITGGHATYEVRAKHGRVRLTAHRPSSPVAGRAFDVETADVTRSGRSLLRRDAHQTVGSEGELVVDRGDVTETWTNGEDGSEQTWRIDSRPVGNGDLVVSVSARGLDYVGTTAGGLHFADANGIGFRYGLATWVDADGARVDVPATYEAGRIVMRVPSDTVESATYPAMLDPVVGPEIGLDSPIPVAVEKNQQRPSVAFDGSNYLVVWDDTRNAASGDVFGARVTPGGVVLDAMGIAIATTSAAEMFPAVAFDGTNYLVVWGGNGDIRGTRISTSGTVLDAPSIAISTATGAQDHPTLAFDGTSYLVVWEDSQSISGPDIYGSFVSTAGFTANVGGIPISVANNVQRNPRVAFDGSNYLVVWEDFRSGASYDIYATRFSTAAVLLDGTGIIISAAANDQYWPAVAFDGTNFLVVWGDSRNGLSDVYGARVATSGTVVDATGFAISSAANGQVFPAIAFDGTNYLVVWQDGRAGTWDVYGAHVTKAAAVVDAAGIAISTAANDQGSPAVAFDGSNCLVVWDDLRRGTDHDIEGSRVAKAGAVLDSGGLVLSTAANVETHPAVAFDGTNYLAVWDDNRSGNSDIYAIRISATGAVIDGSGIPLSTAVGEQSNPAVAFDGTNYLVAWQDGRNGTLDIYGARIATSGSVLDAAGFSVDASANDQKNPCVAFDGVNYLVVWDDLRGGLTSDIYGRRVSPLGALLDAGGIPVSVAANNQQNPAAAFNGSNYLVVWEDLRGGGSTYVYGSRISPAGAVLDGAGIAVSTAASSSNPSVAANGSDFFVVWANGIALEDIYGRRVTAAGSVLDGSGIAISSASFQQQDPAVAWDGTNFLVVWKDDRAATSSDVYGARVDSAGTLLEPNAFVVASGPGGQQAPSVAMNGAGRGLVVYQGVFNSTSVSFRAAARLVCSSPQPAVDTTCDGVDDDCDGTADEDYVASGTTCGVGACASTGLTSCAAGTVGDSCIAGTPAANDATCDGVDDDCDGTVDEDGSCGADGGIDGSLADGGGDAGTRPAASSGGCSCTVAGARESAWSDSGLVLLTALALLGSRRRKSSVW